MLPTRERHVIAVDFRLADEAVGRDARDHQYAMAVFAARCADINGDWEVACQKARAKLAA